MTRLLSIWVLAIALAAVGGARGAIAAAQPSSAEDPHRHHRMTEGVDHGDHKMTLDPSGSVMNANSSELPLDCAEISGEHAFTVYAGVEFAADYPGTTYGLSQHEYVVDPCSLVTVTFVNKDQVRHQWMVHGLPKYLYPQGMFHLEAAGGFEQTGSFVVPSDDRTYLVHCDVAQHMEKGMKGQLKVGRGDGDLWGVPGVSEGLYRDSYAYPNSGMWIALSTAAGISIVFVLYGFWGRT